MADHITDTKFFNSPSGGNMATFTDIVQSDSLDTFRKKTNRVAETVIKLQEQAQDLDANVFNLDGSNVTTGAKLFVPSNGSNTAPVIKFVSGSNPSNVAGLFTNAANTELEVIVKSRKAARVNGAGVVVISDTGSDTTPRGTLHLVSAGGTASASYTKRTSIRMDDTAITNTEYGSRIDIENDARVLRFFSTTRDSNVNAHNNRRRIMDYTSDASAGVTSGRLYITNGSNDYSMIHYDTSTINLGEVGSAKLQNVNVSGLLNANDGLTVDVTAVDKAHIRLKPRTDSAMDSNFGVQSLQSYIHFQAYGDGAYSNDPGRIVHEISGSRSTRDRATLHLIPSDNSNHPQDRVVVHGGHHPSGTASLGINNNMYVSMDTAGGIIANTFKLISTSDGSEKFAIDNGGVITKTAGITSTGTVTAATLVGDVNGGGTTKNGYFNNLNVGTGLTIAAHSAMTEIVDTVADSPSMLTTRLVSEQGIRNATQGAKAFAQRLFNSKIQNNIANTTFIQGRQNIDTVELALGVSFRGDVAPVHPDIHGNHFALFVDGAKSSADDGGGIYINTDDENNDEYIIYGVNSDNSQNGVKFSVKSTTGNTFIAGGLDVNGGATVGSLSLDGSGGIIVNSQPIIGVTNLSTATMTASSSITLDSVALNEVITSSEGIDAASGASDTALVTEKAVATKIEAVEASVDPNPSRNYEFTDKAVASNQVFQNLTGGPLLIIARGGSTNDIQVIGQISSTNFSNPITIADTHIISDGGTDSDASITFVVPASFYYRVTFSSGDGSGSIGTKRLSGFKL